MARLTTSAEIETNDLLPLIEARKREFAILRSAGEYAGAYHIGGYALELLLKRIICKTLDLDRLPVVFHIHNLEALLFFSGLKRQLDADAALKVEFNEASSQWSERSRYAVPGTITPADCDKMDRWLNGAGNVYEWLRSKI